ncbi:MAG: hypothetical protein RL693_945 [Verrucomicrobiota bacterium]|jgi:hypothetical protein
MRFLVILLIIGGLIYGWFALQKNRVENRAKAWAAQLVPHLSDQPISADAQETARKAGANLYWILFYFDKLVMEGMEPGTVLIDACNQLNMPDEKAAILRVNLLANYETAKKYQIFDDITNVVKLEQGTPPLMKMSGWEDEPVALGYIVPPSIAPEAAGALANLTLMPAFVNDVQNDRITTTVLEQARTMEKAKIILKSSFDEIVALAKQAPR